MSSFPPRSAASHQAHMQSGSPGALAFSEVDLQQRGAQQGAAGQQRHPAQHQQYERESSTLPYNTSPDAEYPPGSPILEDYFSDPRTRTAPQDGERHRLSNSLSTHGSTTFLRPQYGGEAAYSQQPARYPQGMSEKPSLLLSKPSVMRRGNDGAEHIRLADSNNEKPAHSVYGNLAPPRGAYGNGSTGMNTPNPPNRQQSNPNLLFADGDYIPPTTAFGRFLNAVFHGHFLIRWLVFIVPITGLLWIPGIIGVTTAPNATVWGVKLLYWSIWLSTFWLSWWAGQLVARTVPTMVKKVIGSVAPELRHYISYITAVKYHLGMVLWAMASWISFLPIIRGNSVSATDATAIRQITQGLFAIFVDLIILLVFKLVIQVIAHNFHRKSYEDRINEQKFNISVLERLYVNSTASAAATPEEKSRGHSANPSMIFKRVLRGAKRAAQTTTTTVIGSVASEIAGERLLQPNAPRSKVIAALSTASRTRDLARRLFYSFAPPGSNALEHASIARFFAEDLELAERAFAIFDRDGNGDASLEEVEMACLEIHRERLALANSMKDIDSAVGRLDAILMSIWWILAIIIFIGFLSTSFQALIAGAGTLILGLSWLIGTTAQEILASVIFLFVKHAYDCGDRVDIDGEKYVVKEMMLLSTVFRRIDGMIVQIPHTLLNTKPILNIRRSGAISENFKWDVDFTTSFEKIEALRARMLEFLRAEKRDFLGQIDITCQDFEAQGKLTLSTDIKYKSNWQNGALKAQRRNKFICALKLTLASLEIYGPAGAGNPAPASPDPTPYTMMPYEAYLASLDKTEATKGDDAPTKKDVMNSAEGIKLSSKEAVMEDEALEEVTQDRQ